jgi:hypothetical protein
MFSNGATILINDSPGGSVAAATPYPSQIAVSGVAGTVTAITATLHGFHHKCPQDVDVLLVGPQGNSSLLMSDAGDCTEDPLRSPVDLTFDGSASTAIPCLHDGTDLFGGTYQTANYPDHDCTTENPDFADSFPDPAPAGPWPTSLSGFAGKDPNGSWQLYVVDDQSGDDGAIDGGWSLTIASSSHPPTPPSRQGPLFSSHTRLVQNVLKTHGVLVSFTSNSSGTLAASGTVRVPRVAKTYRFTSVRKQVAAGPVRVKLGLPRTALGAIKRALGHHRKLSAKITLALTTAGGQTTTKKLTVRLR